MQNETHRPKAVRFSPTLKLNFLLFCLDKCKMTIACNINSYMIVSNYSRNCRPVVISNTLINGDRLSCLYAGSVESDLRRIVARMRVYICNGKQGTLALSQLLRCINSLEFRL